MVNLLVLSNPAAPHLRVLEALPEQVNITVGADLDYVRRAAPEADAILNAMWNAELLRAVLPSAAKTRWIHNLSAGVELAMFPEMARHPAPLTNGRGVFAAPLAEFVLAAALYFAKDFRRMIRQQEAGRWASMDVETIAGKTMGIVGYGAIGRASAQLAHAAGMRVVALRRRIELSGDDPLLDAIFPPDRIREMLARCDYVAIAAPLTAATRGLIGAAELASMRPGAVLINVGRGPVVDEEALIEALREGRLRGAALDVFDKEPLPEGHPFYALRNVLLSPHSADHTPGWIEAAMEMFVRNFDRFLKGEPLENVVDKHAGY